MDNNLDEKKLTPEQRAAKAPDAAVQKKTIKDRLISAFRTGMPKNKKVVAETIRKVDGGYRLVAGSGRNLGTYPTKGGAEKREKQVNYFKHMGEDKKRQVVPPPEAMPSDTRVIKPLPKKGKRTTGSFNKFGNFTPGMKEEVEQVDEEMNNRITKIHVRGQNVIVHKYDTEAKGAYKEVEHHSSADAAQRAARILHKARGRDAELVIGEEIEQIDEINKDTVTKYKKKATNVKRALPSLKREFQRKIEKAEALAAQHSPGGKLPRGVGRNPAIATKAREEAAKAKKSLAVFDRWETNRTKGLERAEKRLEEAAGLKRIYLKKNPSNDKVSVHGVDMNGNVNALGRELHIDLARLRARTHAKKHGLTKASEFNYIKEASDLHCPECDANHGKDRENPQDKKCNQCGHKFKNIHGFKSETDNNPEAAAWLKNFKEEANPFSKQRQDELTSRAKKHQHIANAAHEVGDLETANLHNNHASRIYDHLIKRNMSAIRKNLNAMKQMRSGDSQTQPEISEKDPKHFHVEMYVHNKQKPIFKLLRGTHNSDNLDEKYREFEHDTLEGDLHKIVGDFQPSSLDHNTITRELHEHLAKHGYHSAAASHPVVLSPREQRFKSEFKKRVIAGGGRHERPHNDGESIPDSSRYVGVWSTRHPTHIFDKDNKRIPNATRDGAVTVFNDEELKHAASGKTDRWFARISDVRKTPASGLSTLFKPKKKKNNINSQGKQHSIHGNDMESFLKSKKPNADKLKKSVGIWHRDQLELKGSHLSKAAEAKSSGNHEEAARHLEKAEDVHKKHQDTLNWIKENYPEYHADPKISKLNKKQEVSEGIGAVNRAFGLKPYSVLNPPPKRKPGLLTKIKNKIKDKLGIYEAVRKPEHTHAVVRQGNILSYHKSSKSAHRKADKLDLDYGAVAHSVRRLEPL